MEVEISWVEVGARFSNTRLETPFSKTGIKTGQLICEAISEQTVVQA